MLDSCALQIILMLQMKTYFYVIFSAKIDGVNLFDIYSWLMIKLFNHSDSSLI